jgi:methyltransferase
VSLISELVPFLVFIPMWIEAARASRNERVQRTRGGVEPAKDVYAAMQIAYPGLFLAMVVEGLLRGQPSRGVVIAGVAIFLAAKSLKWWAIRSLGPAWTFRVIVVPGFSLVSSGPYRYLRHPNYLAVVGEFVGVALMTGARITGPIALVIFGYLLAKRIAVEDRALSKPDL